MGFIVHRGERADVLADALADVLAAPLADPFRAEVVAVPAKGIERWLSNRLAGRLGVSAGRNDGVCANLEFPFPGRLVGNALAAATGVDPATDPWRPERLAWPLLDVVEANLAEPWLTVLAAHVGAEPGTDAGRVEADANRRFAAVRHLADLFDRYAVHRPLMLRAWVEGRDENGAGGPLPADALWQAELWRRLRAAVDAASPPERLIAGCDALVATPEVVDLPSRLALFGLTRLPASYLDVLGALAAHRDVHLFALHPSPTLWSTLTPIAPAPSLADAGGIAAERVRHPLLRAWGRDSREMQLVLATRLAGEANGRDRHHPLPEAPTPAEGAASEPTVLALLQDAIRRDAPLPARGDRPALRPDDGSVQVHSCHGRTRQAEVVRDAITHLLAGDPTLEPRDVLVMCPDIDDFAPLLRTAFEAPAASARPIDDNGAGRGDHTLGPGSGVTGPPVIPYRLADRSLRQTNPVLGAVAELLALADSRLTAPQVLAFAALEPVRARFGFGDDDLATMARWITETGIRWGLDADHRAPYGLAAVSTGTWESGIARILLGVTMAEEDQRLVGGVLPFDEIDSSDIDRAGRLAELVGRLGAVVTGLAQPRPIADWAAALDDAANQLLRTYPSEAWQRHQLDRLLSDVTDEAGDGHGPPLRLTELRDLLADRLRGQPTRAAFRTGDLTMCTLVPMRSVPHRVVCLVGLDDGTFPRGGAPDGDDLLVRDHQPGDHDRRAEDRQLLLDAVLAAGDALVITYTGRDPFTNEEVPPAVPINELLDVVDLTVHIAADDPRFTVDTADTADTVGAGPDASSPATAAIAASVADQVPARRAIVRQHPLQPADPRCFEAGRLGVDGPWGFDPHLLAGARAALDAPARPLLASFIAEPLAPVREAVVTLDDLVRFVEHPVKAFLRQRLGISLGDWDDRTLDALTIEMNGLERWAVGNRILTALLNGGDADSVCAAEAARGLLPPGALGAGILDGAARKATAIARAAADAAAGERSSLEVDVVLDGGRQLVGTVPDVIGDVIRPVSFSKLAPKHRAAAWVRFLAATAAHPSRPLSSVCVGAGRKDPAVCRFDALGVTADQRERRARELLAIVVDLRDRGLREPLPLYGDTSHRYAVEVRGANPDAKDQAATYWTSAYRWDKDDRDPEHLLVHDGQLPFDEVWADGPAEGEQGAGWAMDESSRFGRLARRLWDPILDAEAAGRAAAKAAR